MSANMEKKFFVISLEQLKQLCLEKTTPDKRMEIQISVLANPYREPSEPFIAKAGKLLINAIDKATDPPAKKGGKLP